MTLGQILKTAAISLANGGEHSVVMISEESIAEAAMRMQAGCMKYSSRRALLENEAAHYGLKLEFADGNVKITPAHPLVIKPQATSTVANVTMAYVQDLDC